MKTVNIHAAKTHLSRLVDDVVAGEEVVIAKNGKPMARLVPFETEAKKRVLGRLAGKIRIPDDFDTPLPDNLLKEFLGG